MSLIATRYAEALYSLAVAENKVAEYKKDVDSVLDTFISADVKPFFASERVTKQEKKDLIAKCFAGKVEGNVLNFLFVLVDKGRMIHFKDIFQAFHSLCNGHLGIKEGVVESARPLTKEQIAMLEEHLSKDGEKVELIEKINTSLISGFKITFGTEVIDATMKEKIKKMNELLKGKDVSLWN